MSSEEPWELGVGNSLCHRAFVSDGCKDTLCLLEEFLHVGLHMTLLLSKKLSKGRDLCELAQA